MNVWFPSKYSSASAVVLKQYFLFVLSNGPRIIGPLDVNTSEASKGENVYCNMDKVYSQQVNIVPIQMCMSCEIDDLINSYMSIWWKKGILFQ